MFPREREGEHGAQPRQGGTICGRRATPSCTYLHATERLTRPTAPKAFLRSLRAEVVKSAQAGRIAMVAHSKKKRPVSIAGMTGFVGQVKFADGKVWIPNRAPVNLSRGRTDDLSLRC
jgi:hypothetical protein